MVTLTEPELDWVGTLTAPGPRRDHAIRRLHAMLLRAAHADARRRANPTRFAGPELDDLAHQAANDALVAITARLDLFRGESRFTTWAHKFVIFEVGVKINRHRWSRERVLLADDAVWVRVPDRSGARPETEAEWRELVDGVRRAVATALSDRQRTVFLALVVDGVPVDELSAQLGTNRNAVYQTMFGARRKIRAALAADGLLGDGGG